jgi:hypothetical protein
MPCLYGDEKTNPKPLLVFAPQAKSVPELVEGKRFPSSAKKCRSHFLADATYFLLRRIQSVNGISGGFIK